MDAAHAGGVVGSYVRPRPSARTFGALSLRESAAVPLLVAALAAVVWAIARTRLVDDAYITLAYARNLALAQHWGLTRHDISNTATSPLDVIVLGAVTFLIRSPIAAVGVVFVACQVIWYDALRRVATRAGLPPWTALLAVGLALFNPLLVSSIGLEVAMGATLTGVLMAYAGSRPVVAGIVAGLLVLTRADLGIFAAAIIIGSREARREWLKTLLAAMAVALPWFVFSWVKLGSATPETLIIKMLQKDILQQLWGGYDFANGWRRYFATYPIATTLAFLPAIGGAAALGWWAVMRFTGASIVARRLDPFASLAVGGVVHFLAYCALGVPPYHWYYAPSVGALTVFFAAAAAALATRTKVVLASALAVAAASATLLSIEAVKSSSAPITTNWASSAEYARIGGDLHRLVGSSIVRSPGEIGTLVYFCGCNLMDEFSDPGYIPALVDKVRARGGRIERALIDLNYAFLDRGATPRKQAFAMRYVHNVDRRAIAFWPVDSPWVGVGYFELFRDDR